MPGRHVALVQDAHRRLVAAIDALSDADVRRPSLLPGWSVAHVLTHLARNGDSHVRRAEAAGRGEVVDQYEGGYASRNAEIESGSSRSASELIEDVERSARAVERAWDDVRPTDWTARSRDANGRERPLFELPSRRWQEVEVHLVDLNIGVTPRDWPAGFVMEWLPRTRERMWVDLPAGLDRADFADPADELAWLYGRLERDDLPSPPAWG